MSKYTKIVVISTLGDISMNITEQFYSYLDGIMKILFSACHLALELSDEVFKFIYFLREMKIMLSI